MLSGMKGSVTAAGDISRCHGTARAEHTGSHIFTCEEVPSTREAYEIVFILLRDLPRMSQTDPEQSHTADLHTDLSVTHCCAPPGRRVAAHLLNLWQGLLLIVSRLAPAIRITL